MNQHTHTITARCVQTVLGLALLCAQSMSALAGDPAEVAKRGAHHHHHDRVTLIRGITITGTNSVLGKPIFSWGGDYGSFNFPTIFAYNPQGAEPLELNENTPGSTLLATGVSPLYLQIRGDSPDVVKPEWVNVPLRKVPVNVDFDPSLTQKEVLPGLYEAAPAALSQAEPATPITLAQWMRASGVATIDCSGEGADIKLRMRNLVPNRVYTVWATMQLAEPASGSYSFTLPVGGTPSVFLTDDNGDATYKRWIKFCPLDKQATDAPMLTIEVLYHANHSTYGAIPAPGLMLGLITFPHLLFPINVELLDKNAGDAR